MTNQNAASNIIGTDWVNGCVYMNTPRRKLPLAGAFLLFEIILAFAKISCIFNCKQLNPVHTPNQPTVIMDKRTFLKVSSAATAGFILAPVAACNSAAEGEKTTTEDAAAMRTFTLPALGYEFAALEPNIDARTMEIHHDKHHAGYVRKLNAALEGTSYAGKTLDEIMATVQVDDTGVRNNGGGHYNHSLFWKVMAPNAGGQPEGKLAEAINAGFGSYEDFMTEFSGAAKGVFGSGWAWLCADKDSKLFVTATPNQDNPTMVNIVERTGTPILGIDVWEHAYYLKYQNRRGDYIGNFFNLINWEQVASQYAAIG